MAGPRSTAGGTTPPTAALLQLRFSDRGVEEGLASETASTPRVLIDAGHRRK